MAEPYTDTDVEVVGDAIATYYQDIGLTGVPDPYGAAEAICAALAAAGRLTPADAVVEYVVIVDGKPTSEPYGGYDSREYAEEVAEAYGPHRAHVAQRQRWVGPWLPVPTEEDTDG